MTVHIEIKWGTKKFNVEFTDEEFDTMTVHQLKLHCQLLTEVEPEYMKLLSRGAVLKNDKELLKNYKIVSGSKMMLMGSKSHISPLKAPPPKENAAISTRLQWIKNIRESVLKPDIHRYEKQAQEHIAQQIKTPHDPQQTKELINYGNYLHEQLMHMFSQLDTMPEAKDEERVERRTSVKETEALLDLIESIKAKLSSLLQQQKS